MSQDDRAERARTAAATKAARKDKAGLARTIKVRIYPKPEQADEINRTIGAVRFVWNRCWLPLVETAENALWDYVRAHGWSEDLPKEERDKLWKGGLESAPRSEKQHGTH